MCARDGVAHDVAAKLRAAARPLASCGKAARNLVLIFRGFASCCGKAARGEAAYNLVINISGHVL